MIRERETAFRSAEDVIRREIALEVGAVDFARFRAGVMARLSREVGAQLVRSPTNRGLGPNLRQRMHAVLEASALPPAVGRALREATPDLDAERFRKTTRERLEVLLNEELPSKVSVAIRAEILAAVASRDFSMGSNDLERRLADVHHEALGARTREALRADVLASIEGVDFGTLRARILERVGSLVATDTADRTVEALRAESARAVEQVDFGAFRGQVSARIDRMVEVDDADRTAEALRAESAQALGRVDFAAFHAQLMERLERLIEADIPLSDSVTSALRAEVPTPPAERVQTTAKVEPTLRVVSSSEPTVEGSNERIEPTLRVVGGSNAKSTPRKTSPRWLIGAVTAGLAAAAAWALSLAPTAQPLPTKSDPIAVHQPSGVVSVDDVSFEGTVTVLNDEGLAVIWLADT